MFFNHPVSDLVARIKNGYMVNKPVITSPVSRLREGILSILKNEGYILNFTKVKEPGLSARFDVQLKYHYSVPVVSEIQVVSKPGKRIYCNADKIPLVKNGLGMVVLSTSQGIIADHDARSKKIGGEVLFKVF
ncbi:MAG: 30S ribosomal protein S8 [Proteobacteria bacterium]|nr:30S ribosomal protein S8 [Pseudomonadota bacterium]